MDKEAPDFIIDEVLIGTLESLLNRLDADKDLAEIKALGYVIKWYKGER